MPMNKEKIAVAMSGGVDSSVAAALLTEEYGKENVFGVTMRLFCYAEKSASPKACCSIESINDAKAVCKKLGIKHYVIDFEKEFEKEVIENFVSEYQAGHTPNPCIRCNSIMKSKYLMDKVRELGAGKVATGHYARIVQSTINNKQLAKYQRLKTNDWKLLKGADTKKDQSYFLYGMTQDQLAHTLFPLGDITKDEARKIAKKYDLKTAEKTESQEICFIEGGNYHDFLKERLVRIDEGEIVDAKGRTLGKHKGLAFYTVGQRKGLGIAAKDPLYVVSLDTKKNQVVVGKEKDLYKKDFEVKDINWLTLPKCEPNCTSEVSVSIRYNMEPQKAMIYSSSEVERSREVLVSNGLKLSNTSSNKTVRVVFKEPQRSITSGQSAVFYDSDVVLGGGIIV